MRNSFPYNKNKFGHRDTQGKHQMITKAEIGVMCIQSKNCQGWLTATILGWKDA